MKHKIKFLALFALLVLVITSFHFSAMAADTTAVEYQLNLERAMTNFEELRLLFQTVANETEYPDFVGGMYFNDEGNLALLIVEAYTSEKLELYNLVNAFATENGVVIDFHTMS